RAAAMPARPDVAPLRPNCRRPLEDDLPEEQDEHSRHVEAVREEGAVAGVRALVLLDPADGEDHLVGLARQEVPAARASLPEQTDPRGPPALDLRAVGRLRAGHRAAALLLRPAE